MPRNVAATKSALIWSISLRVASRGICESPSIYGSGEADTNGQLPDSSGWSMASQPCRVDPFRPACPSCKRSEEHTSELQSLTNLVCRLLLEKKNTSQQYQ